LPTPARSPKPRRAPASRSKPSSSAVAIAYSQFAASPDVATNRSKQVALADRTGRDGANIFCTQELCTTQYFCQSEDHRFFQLAESIPGPTTDALAKVAKRHNMAIVASLFERRAPGLYHNTAAIIDADGALLGVYRKMHIPDDPLFYEKFYFTPGDATDNHGAPGFRAWKTRHAAIGVLICWDQWFPEAARLTAMAGAEILFYPTAIGWHPSEKREYGKSQHESWETIQRSHAIANGCFVCAPNRVGHERILNASGKPVSNDGLEFWGQGFVAAPNGQVLHRASITKEEVAVVHCDLDTVEFARTHWPFLRDRRIDAYAHLTKRLLVP
jgi:N-carbamoylputrescine amidase